MIIVTGAAGFIGSNLIKGLNQKGYTEIIAVDDLTDGRKFKNLVSCNIMDYQDYAVFVEDLAQGHYANSPIQCVFHQGACSTTTEWNGRYMMKNNYEYSKSLLRYCLQKNIQFIYASSAAVYGLNAVFSEKPGNEAPLNVYGYSKLLFDHYVRCLMPTLKSQVVGLRYFNVYGPQETHKGKMASVAFHLMNQLRDQGVVKLFAGNEGYGDGEQCRDFVYVEDVVRVNLWLFENPAVSGILNVGTGKAMPFNAVAKMLLALHGHGSLEYIPFPEHLKGAYQSFTEADIGLLRRAGYQPAFHSLEQGLQKYYAWWQAQATSQLPELSHTQTA